MIKKGFLLLLILVFLGFINKITLESLQIYKSFSNPQSYFFSDPGAINTVNTLRGEDYNSFLGKLMHNRSILFYKYLENVTGEFNPVFIFKKTGILFFPFIIGLYQFTQKKYKGRKVIITYLVAICLILGFFRTELLEQNFILLLPVLAIIILIGIEKIFKI